MSKPIIDSNGNGIKQYDAVEKLGCLQDAYFSVESMTTCKSNNKQHFLYKTDKILNLELRGLYVTLIQLNFALPYHDRH